MNILTSKRMKPQHGCNHQYLLPLALFPWFTTTLTRLQVDSYKNSNFHFLIVKQMSMRFAKASPQTRVSPTTLTAYYCLMCFLSIII